MLFNFSENSDETLDFRHAQDRGNMLSKQGLTIHVLSFKVNQTFHFLAGIALPRCDTDDFLGSPLETLPV